MPVAVVAAVLAAIAWGYLLVGHGGYWRTSHRLPPGAGEAGLDGAKAAGAEGGPWPSVVAVVPARDEAGVLPLTLPSLLAQDYPGAFSVVLVDDGSRDGTLAVARSLARGHERALRLVSGTAPPQGWAGKVWAMAQGLRAAGPCDFVVFTDADIAFGHGALRALVRGALAGRFDLVSQMALLRADSGWERIVVPAFVYFFAQLYPFRRASRHRSRTAAAAGGCMLVRRQTLVAAGGLEPIRGARIDDVALARLLKRPPVLARCWLGFTTLVHSRRPYPRLGALWDMVARSAYTQLRYSPALLSATVAGLVWIYLLPPVAAIGGLIGLAAGAGTGTGWFALAGLAGWVIMTATYLPVLRLYGLSPWRAPTLPAIALLYAAMTVDSARRHHAGQGGEWKGRTIPGQG